MSEAGTLIHGRPLQPAGVKGVILPLQGPPPRRLSSVCEVTGTFVPPAFAPQFLIGHVILALANRPSNWSPVRPPSHSLPYRRANAAAAAFAPCSGMVGNQAPRRCVRLNASSQHQDPGDQSSNQADGNTPPPLSTKRSDEKTPGDLISRGHPPSINSPSPAHHLCVSLCYSLSPLHLHHWPTDCNSEDRYVSDIAQLHPHEHHRKKAAS